VPQPLLAVLVLSQSISAPRHPERSEGSLSALGFLCALCVSAVQAFIFLRFPSAFPL
jgi:hypothetical protein